MLYIIRHSPSVQELDPYLDLFTQLPILHTYLLAKIKENTHQYKESYALLKSLENHGLKNNVILLVEAGDVAFRGGLVVDAYNSYCKVCYNYPNCVRTPHRQTP